VRSHEGYQLLDFFLFFFFFFSQGQGKKPIRSLHVIAC